MKLIGLLDSPYVRRVAISLELYGIECELEKLSTFGSCTAFSRINPVLKAPTMLLDDGTRLMDSTLILNYFETLAAKEKKLLPVRPHDLAEDLQLLGLILAACEKTVQYVYEQRLRPAEKQHQPWIDRITGQLLAACQEWNAQLKKRRTAERPDQIAVTGGVVWRFIQLHRPDVVIAGDFDHIRALAEETGSHPAFKKYAVAGQ